ncbi:UNVERIFIED_CONTAM: hypothetical protein K2H54_003465 [Gekko kuhli]
MDISLISSHCSQIIWAFAPQNVKVGFGFQIRGLEDFVLHLEKYRRSGQELYAILNKDQAQRLLCIHNKSAKVWAELEEQLFRREDPGGATPAHPASRWTLDGHEGPARMRKRIRLRVTHHTAVATKDTVTGMSEEMLLGIFYQ